MSILVQCLLLFCQGVFVLSLILAPLVWFTQKPMSRPDDDEEDSK